MSGWRAESKTASLIALSGDSTREPDGRYRIPGAQTLARRTIDEVQAMLAPLLAGGVPAARDLDRRLQAVSAALSLDGNLIGSDDIALLTAGPGQGGDSLHMLVMDVHRELNALEGQIATESIDGARVHDLSPADRGVVRAFMRGVHATERLKFDHPGLGTIATRTGPTLVIQNDPGTTDAHIVVIKVTGRVVTITYTDVHLGGCCSLRISWHRFRWCGRTRGLGAIRRSRAVCSTLQADGSRPMTNLRRSV